MNEKFYRITHPKTPEQRAAEESKFAAEREAAERSAAEREAAEKDAAAAKKAAAAEMAAAAEKATSPEKATTPAAASSPAPAAPSPQRERATPVATNSATRSSPAASRTTPPSATRGELSSNPHQLARIRSLFPRQKGGRGVAGAAASDMMLDLELLKAKIADLRSSVQVLAPCSSR